MAKKFIRAVYSTNANGKRPVRTAVLSMGRGNGKSTLASLLALAQRGRHFELGDGLNLPGFYSLHAGELGLPHPDAGAPGCGSGSLMRSGQERILIPGSPVRHGRHDLTGIDSARVAGQILVQQRKALAG